MSEKDMLLTLLIHLLKDRQESNGTLGALPAHRHQELGLAAELLALTAHLCRDSTPYYCLLAELTGLFLDQFWLR